MQLWTLGGVLIGTSGPGPNPSYPQMPSPGPVPVSSPLLVNGGQLKIW